MCGSYNSGKLSCCAPGGSWFKKCGSPPKLYTWLQGTQTCNSETTYTRIMFSYAIIRPKLLVTRDARGLSQTLVGQFCDIYSAPINSLGHACVISFPQYHATRCAHCVFGFELTRVNLAHQLLSTCMCVTTIVQAQRQQQRQGGLRVGTHG